jgi:thioredoxin-like negative regulator of GroEL
MTNSVLPITEAEFRAQVLRSPQPVLVAFRANWCVPSQQIASELETIANKFRGRVRVATVDVVDPQRDRLCRAYDVTRLPVVVLFKDGEPKDQIGGVTDAANIAEMVDAQLKPVIDLSEFNFEREVLRSRVPVLVHFWAAWCRPSLEMEQVINELAERFQERAKVARLEMRPDTARLFGACGVNRVPTTVVFRNGRIEDRILGAMTGGTKTDAVRTSCVGLTSSDNLAQMLERFAM